MAMRYAHEGDVLDQLRIDPESTDPEEVAKVARARRLELGVCDALDHKIGRSFGTPLPETVLVQPRPGHELLMLPKPLRSITAITAGGVVLDPSLVAPHFVIDEGALALRLVELTTWWYGTVAVTGIWAGAALEGEVPHDIREAATFITVDEFRTRNASPAGQIGPDGQMVPVRNPWKYELVQAAIARHRLSLRGLGV